MSNFTRANLARAVVEGTLASQAAMLDALAACDLHVDRLILIGGAAASPAVQAVLTQLVQVPVSIPAPDEYVTKGAAMQAASTLLGSFPRWPLEQRVLPPAPIEERITGQRLAAMADLGYVERPALH